MTKSTITREQLLEIIETDHVQCGEASYLARMALAAMDGEPVAEVYQVPNVGICAALGPSIRMLCPLEPGTKLYRHAQPDTSHLSRICAECTHVWYHGKKYNGKKRSHCLRCGKVEYKLDGNPAAPEVECQHEWVAYGMSKDKWTGVFATLCRCRLCGLRSRAGVIEPLQEVQQEIKS